MLNIIVSKYTETNHFGRLLGMDFKVIEPGKIEYRMKIEEKHLATPKASHGGAIAALMDALLGLAALSIVAADGKAVSTVEFKINYFSPTFLNDQLVGYAEVEKKGSRIIFTSGKVMAENRNMEVVATGTGTFNAYPVEKAGY